MKRFIYYLIMILPLSAALVLSSCHRGGGDSLRDSDSSAVASDSVCNAEAERKNPSEPPFDTVEDARKWVLQGESAAKYADGILPRMLNEVPEYALKLVNNTYNGFIVVDKFRMLVILYDRFGRVQKEYKMACAKNYGTKHKKADSRTPEGFFSVEGKYNSTDWLFTDDNGVTSPVKGQFGPRFIRLKIPNTSQIGIHGTGSPWSLGGRRSHGCIRISNENILELVDLVEVGMPVIVSPGRRDMGVNEAEGYDIPAITTGTERPTPLRLTGSSTYENPNSDAPKDTVTQKEAAPTETTPTEITPAETAPTETAPTESAPATPSTETAD